MASLVLISGQRQGDAYPLGHRTNVVGRQESLPIQIVDASVSRKHVQIRFDRDADQYYALDMHSTNGVFVNGRRITAETVLADQDRIQIGRTTVLFTLSNIDGDTRTSHQFKKRGERARRTRADWFGQKQDAQQAGLSGPAQGANMRANQGMRRSISGRSPGKAMRLEPIGPTR